MQMDFEYPDVAQMIDHAMLLPSMTTEDLVAGCRLAVAFDVASVCILPYAVKLCDEELVNSTVRVSTVIGFPHGSNRSEVKRTEAELALADGCDELDTVVNISRVMSNDWDYVRTDLAGVIEVAHAVGKKVKVIFENHYLENDHKRRLCEICNELNADWVKTSTGFAGSGASIKDVQLMHACVASHVQIKAAGGIRDLDTLLEYRKQGVTRIGISGTAEMLDDCRKRLNLPPICVGNVSTAEGY